MGVARAVLEVDWRSLVDVVELVGNGLPVVCFGYSSVGRGSYPVSIVFLKQFSFLFMGTCISAFDRVSR